MSTGGAAATARSPAAVLGGPAPTATRGAAPAGPPQRAGRAPSLAEVLEQHASNAAAAASPAGAAWTTRSLDKAVAWARLADKLGAAASGDGGAARKAARPAAYWPELRVVAEMAGERGDGGVGAPVRELLRAVVHSAYTSEEVRHACVRMDPSMAREQARRAAAERALEGLAPELDELGWTLADAVREVALAEARRRAVPGP